MSSNQVSKKTAGTVVAAGLLTVGLVGCSGYGTNMDAKPGYTYTPTSTEATVTPAATETDPYSSDGNWLVPTEIAPGTYRVLNASSIAGYSQVCADYACEIGTPGFISNENYSGPGVLVVPSNAVSVLIKRVTLTRMS